MKLLIQSDFPDPIARSGPMTLPNGGCIHPRRNSVGSDLGLNSAIFRIFQGYKLVLKQSHKTTNSVTKVTINQFQNFGVL